MVKGFEAFWSLVDSALLPGGRVFFVDSLWADSSSAKDHPIPDQDRGTALRKLDDGREFKIVKVFHDPRELEGRLSMMGWNIDVRRTANYFLYGHGTRKG